MRTVTITDRKDVLNTSAMLIAEYNKHHAEPGDEITPDELVKTIIKKMVCEIHEAFERDLLK